MKILIKEPSTKKWDYAAVCFAVLLRILTFFLCQVKNTPDSLEYIHINGFQWLTGTVDRYRLPLYPMLIEVCQQITGSKYLIAVCLVQLAVSIASLIALYALFKKLSDKQYIYLPLFILCSASAVMGNWDKLILTESLSLSLVVFLLWGLVCYIKENKLRYLVIAIVASGLGAFLRATFALYTGAIFVFLLLQVCFPGSKESGKPRRNNAIKGLIITAVPIVLIFCYALVFSLQHGSFTLSHSGLGQQLVIVIEKGYYTDSTDEEIKQDIQHILDTKLPEEITDQEQASITDQKYIDTLQEFFQNIYNREESIDEYDHI